MDRSMLNKATSSDDSPTPGYMYGEIAKMTHASFEVCKQMEDFLLKRLEKKNANVKRKTLILIKHVARQGRPEFRRDLCRQLGPLKECLSFNGPPDPLRGDEPYAKVREAAKEALDAVTSSDPIHQPGVIASGIPGGRIEGYGGGGADGSGYGPGAQQGYGGYPSGQQGQGYPPGGGGYPQQGYPQQQSFSSHGGARFEGYGGNPVGPPEEPSSYTGKAMSFASGVRDKIGAAAARGTSNATGPYVGGAERAQGSYLPNAQGSTRMAGIGNPNFQDARNQSQHSWADKASRAVRNIGFKQDIKEDLSQQYASNRGANSWNNVGDPNGSYNVPVQLREQAWQQQQQQEQAQQEAYATEAAYTTENAGRSADYSSVVPTTQSFGQQRHAESSAYGQRARGAPGGSWGAPQQPRERQPAGPAAPSHESSSSFATPPPPVASQQRGFGGGGPAGPPGAAMAPTVGRAGGANRDGEYEKSLIADLCAAGGTRAAPPPEKLASFVEAARTLEADVVGPNLLDFLGDDQPPQVKAKALAVITALAEDAECESHKSYFVEVVDHVATLAERPPLSVQRNARKTLHALGYEPPETQAGNDEGVPDARRAARRAPNADQDASDFFVPASSGVADGAAVGEEAPAQNGASSLGGPVDLLGDYDEGGAGPAVPEEAPFPTTASPNGEAHINDDPLAGAATADAEEPVAVSEPPSSLFGDLSVKEQQPTAPADEPAQPEKPVAPLDPFDFSAPAADNAASSALDAPVTDGVAAAGTDPFAEAGISLTQPQPPQEKKPPPEVPKPKMTGGDPFASLGELGDAKKKPAAAPATGPAFLASAHATPGYMQQQALQQQQAQMQAQMVALMQQQQQLAAQQRALGVMPAGTGPMPSPAGPAYPPMSSSPVGVGFPGGGHAGSLPPPNAVGGAAGSSGFDFMSRDSAKKRADSFSFVNDMMK